MLDFIWTLPVQLWGTRNKWTLQKILIHGRIRTTNSGTFCFPACTSNPSATETDDDLILELLQYLLTLRHYKNPVPCAKGYRENENKIIAYLQSGDWLPFKYEMDNAKEEIYFVLCVITIYNFYSFFLFIIVYIVCIIIRFFILYLCNDQGKKIVQTTLTNIDVITRQTMQVWNWLIWFGLFVQRSVNRNRQHLYWKKKCR